MIGSLAELIPGDSISVENSEAKIYVGFEINEIS
jgi:hypothetical protein